MCGKGSARGGAGTTHWNKVRSDGERVPRKGKGMKALELRGLIVIRGSGWGGRVGGMEGKEREEQTKRRKRRAKP